MSALSFNRQRKAAYAAQANRASRNQDAIEGPIVGRFVEREVTVKCRACELGCERCDGTGRVVKRGRDGKVETVEVIVHDERADKAPAATPTAAPTREVHAAKRRRQLSAWARCRGHVIAGANCCSCGCPAAEAT